MKSVCLLSDWPVCGFLCATLHTAEVHSGWRMYLLSSCVVCACNVNILLWRISFHIAKRISQTKLPGAERSKLYCLCQQSEMLPRHLTNAHLTATCIQCLEGVYITQFCHESLFPHSSPPSLIFKCGQTSGLVLCAVSAYKIVVIAFLWLSG